MKNKYVPPTKKWMSSGKEYIRKIRIYPAFLYHHLDKWLKLMSLSGWHIVHCGLFTFWFEKGEPCEKEYFTYGLSTQEGKYSISLRYPMLEKTYGVKKDKSKINANDTKSYQILEIDRQRIDVANNVGYRELILDRNRLYLQYFARNLGVILGVATLTIIALLLFSK